MSGTTPAIRTRPKGLPVSPSAPTRTSSRTAALRVGSAALLASLAVTSLAVTSPAAGARPGPGPASERAAQQACPASASVAARPGLTAHLPGSTNHEAMLNSLIRNARSGSTIRVAMWAFTNTSLASRLVAAARDCGVHVQVLVPRNFQHPDGQTGDFPYPATKQLQRALNNDDDPRSYVTVVAHSARGADSVSGQGTTMHQKSWQFTATGSSRKVTVITSANATNEARTLQATDAYTWTGATSTGAKVFDDAWAMFDQQRLDRALAAPWRAPTLGSAQLFWGPWTPGMADPVAARINALPTDRDMTIRIANASWAGAHGTRIADALVGKVARARANGHKVGVFLIADISEPISDRLLPIKPRWCPSSGASGYLHSKFMTVKTSVDNTNPSFNVWAGSANWNGGAVTADELGFRVPGATAYTSYVSYFGDIAEEFKPGCGFPVMTDAAYKDAPGGGAE